MAANKPTQPDDHFADVLEQLAIKNAEFLASIPQEQRRHHIRQAMKSAEVVYAIWYSDDERCCYCIKGKATPEGKKVAPIAFVVRNMGDALGMEADWGDGPPKSTATN